MLFQVPRLCRAMAAAEICGLLTVAGCAPRPRLEFPAPEDEPPVAIRTVVEGFKPHHRLSLGLGEGEPVEASFRRLEGDSLLVKELYWKKGMIGRSLKEKDGLTPLAMADITSLTVYRYTTLQNITIGAGIAAALLFFVMMATERPQE